MQTNELLTAIEQKIPKKKVDALTKIAAESNYSVKEVIDLTFHPEEQIGFRASWILENIYTTYLERFLPAATYFLERFNQQQNPSCQRHFSKILALMTSKKAPSAIQKILNSYHDEKLIETTFAWLINSKTPVAVKCHCLNILANLSVKNKWIAPELIDTMDFLIPKESIAFFGRVKQVKKQLSGSYSD